jgi:hypothetical protein
VGTEENTKPQFIPNFDRYTSLRTNWDYSIKFLDYLRNALSGKLSENVVTIALAGSFGRLEGAATSDADYILVVNNTGDESVENDQTFVRAAIEEYKVSPPNKSGVFSAARTINDLSEHLGLATEKVDELGKRMLLLLESRPVFNDAKYEALITELFSKYAEYLKGAPDKEYVFLLNDLIRYFRYICVNYQATFWRENEKWVIRNLKLRHSRVIMYAGLLFLIGEASKYQGDKKISFVREHLALTPLERLGLVYKENNDHGFFRVIGLYNVFLSRLSDEAWRTRLNVEYDHRYSLPEFSEMKANSDALVAELIRFVFARRGHWSDRFFEYLIF